MTKILCPFDPTPDPAEIVVNPDPPLDPTNHRYECWSRTWGVPGFQDFMLRLGQACRSLVWLKIPKGCQLEWGVQGFQDFMLGSRVRSGGGFRISFGWWGYSTLVCRKILKSTLDLGANPCLREAAACTGACPEVRLKGACGW